MQAFFARLDRALTVMEIVAVSIAAVAILVAMITISVDALGRYFLNRPLIITVDLVTRYLLPIMMLIGAGLVLRKGKHISVDIFASHMPQRLSQAIMGISLLVTGAIVLIMAYRVGHTAAQSFVEGRATFGIIAWPIWLEQAIYTVCLGLLMLRLFHVAASNIIAAVTGNPSIAIEITGKHDAPFEEAI